MRPEGMVEGLFLLGVSAGVGKTTLGVALATALGHRKLRVSASKPIELGCSPLPSPSSSGGALDSDALRSLARLHELAGPPPASTFAGLPADRLQPRYSLLLAAASSLDLPLDQRAPFRYAPELLDPAVAARIAERPIDLEAVVEVVARQRALSDLVLVEGTFGLCTPLTESALEADLLSRLGLPALLVAPSRPGCVHQVLSSLGLLRARRIPCAGVVLVRLDRPLRAEEAAYPFEIERFAGPVVRGVFPHFDERERADLEHLARRIAVHLDLETLLAAEPNREGLGQE